MEMITSRGNSYLWFPDKPDIVHRWQTIGLIVAPEEGHPEVLNYFRIFISGNTKQKVEKFVSYQRKKIREYLKNLEANQLKEGQIGGIQVTVRKLEAQNIPSKPIQTDVYSHEQFKEILKNSQKNGPDFLTSIGEINIGIDRVDMHTQPPYEIKYVIDPLLPKGGNQTVQFSADEPGVSCQTSRGSVDVTTYELNKQQTWVQKDNRPVAGVNPGFPKFRKEFTGNWQVQFIGIDVQNVFTYSFTKVVLP